jgi:LysM repeat protein
MSTAALHGSFGSVPRAATPTRSVRATTAQPRLHLTRRGRSVLTTLAAIPLVLAAFAFVINGGGATATLEGSKVPFEYVTVQPGQSLWQIAETVAPAADPRDVILEFMSLNGLDSSDIVAGQELAIPVAYSD